MNKLIPLDLSDPKLATYSRIGTVTMVLLADFMPAFPMYMGMLDHSAKSLLTMHETAGKVEGYDPDEMRDANPFKDAKVAKAQMIPRSAILRYENVELALNTFAILEYLRLVGKIHFWYTDDGICASKESLEDLADELTEEIPGFETEDES